MENITENYGVGPLIWYCGTVFNKDGSIDYYLNIDGKLQKTRTINPDDSVTVHIRDIPGNGTDSAA